MDIGIVIYGILSARSDISNIVGDKIYPLYQPQTYPIPCITYQALEPNPTKIKDGASPLDEYTVQVNSVSNSYSDCRVLAELVRNTMDFKSGTYGGISVQFISYQGGSSDWHNEMELEGAAMISQDYLIRIVR